MKLGGVPVPAVGFNPHVYVCGRASGEKPVINGDINKEFWANAQWTQDFSDIEGSIRPKPLKETKTKLLWDDEYLYIGAIIYEDQIWANVTGRDDVIFHDNDYEIFLDWAKTTHTYFEFEINARNVLWDLLLSKPYRDGGRPFDNWDAKGIKTAVMIDGELNNPNADNKSWSVEMAIPWAIFAERPEIAKPPVYGDYMRFNISRVEWRVNVENGEYKKVINPETGNPYPEDNWVYAPTGVVNIHYPELWSFLFFAENSTDSYDIPEIEYIKWELRKVYYYQRNYYEKNKCFSTSIEKNDEGIEVCSGIKIETTSDLFQAYCKTKDGATQVNIREDGYVWLS